MDSTLGTIREEIRKNREGNIPTLILVIDTNILADHAWARDNNITYLIEEIVPDHPEFLIVVPHICKVEFKLINNERRSECMERSYLKSNIFGTRISKNSL